MIAPVTVVGILMLAILAAISSTNQAFAYSSYHKAYYKGHHGYYKSSKYTKREGNIRSSESVTTGNEAQGTSNTGNEAQGTSNTGNAAQESSNTGNGAQGTSNTATIQVKCTTGYIWLPTGGFRHCALGTVVNAPQGSTSTHPGLKTGSSALFSISSFLDLPIP